MEKKPSDYAKELGHNPRLPDDLIAALEAAGDYLDRASEIPDEHFAVRQRRNQKVVSIASHPRFQGKRSETTPNVFQFETDYIPPLA